jgi:hypothetical protein
MKRFSASRAGASTAAPRSTARLRFADDLVLPRMLHMRSCCARRIRTR